MSRAAPHMRTTHQLPTASRPGTADERQDAMTTRATTGRRCNAVLDSPIGPLTMVGSGGQLTALYMDAQRHAPDLAAAGETGDPAAEPFASAAAQLSAYFAGELTDFDLPLAPAGTAFQQLVWAALRQIPYGTTESYGQLAARIGRPDASRAVGLANGRNPIAIVVPCHRVIGSDGSLTGYGGGLDRKRFLLRLERASVSG
jgi:methylated-DNA-[protein]-cysteine S-methyltransferase